MGQYDMDKQYTHSWFEFTEEMDLPSRLGITECPTLVMLPREWTGRENRSLDDMRIWNNEGDWRDWMNSQIDQLPKPEPSDVWTRKLLVDRDGVEARTHQRISVLPPQLPKYSETGYLKLPMPDELFDAFVTEYKNNQDHKHRESWHKESTQTNFHDVPMTMVGMPRNAHQLAAKYLRPAIAKWAGVDENILKLKSFYGTREYYRGSELRTHIDIVDTHVLSAILNIDQVGMDEDWELEVLDHYGKRVNISMKPKEMILYESATTPHGRPFPMKGEKYVNAFVHYCPDGWDWGEEGWLGVKSATNYQGPPHAFFEKLHHANPHANAPPHPTSVAQDRTVKFTNEAKGPRDLWWQGDGHIMFQATLKAGDSVNVSTVDGHSFFWTIVDDHSKGTAALRGLRTGDVHLVEAHLETYTHIGEL